MEHDIKSQCSLTWPPCSFGFLGGMETIGLRGVVVGETNIDHHKDEMKIGALQMQHPGEANMEYLRVVKIQGIQHLEMIHVSLTLFHLPGKLSQFAA